MIGMSLRGMLRWVWGRRGADVFDFWVLYGGRFGVGYDVALGMGSNV